MPMSTTVGDLVAALFDKYERRFHDEELAARATQETLSEVLRNGRLKISNRTRGR